MEFREVDRRYAEIKRRHDMNALDDVDFDVQMQQLMVQDQQGRWWAKDRNTGQWMYHDGSNWSQGTPPGYEVIPHTYPTPNTLVRPSGSVANLWGLWLGLGLFCAVLALVFNIIGFPLGIAGIVFGALMVRAGRQVGSGGIRIGGILVIVANLGAMLLWVLIFLLAILFA